jgi:hypothetical protein
MSEPDRADAPATITWRGKTLTRQMKYRGYSGFVGYHNAFYDSGISFSVDGGNATIELCDEIMERFEFEGTGANEIEALDAAALLMEAWLADLTRVLKGERIDV